MAQLFSQYTSGLQLTAGTITGSTLGASGLNPIVDRLNSISSSDNLITGSVISGTSSFIAVSGIVADNTILSGTNMKYQGLNQAGHYCRVEDSNGFVLSSGTAYTVITWDNEQFDPYGMHIANGSGINILSDGLYLVQGNIPFVNASGGTVEANITLNGGERLYNRKYVTNNGFQTFNFGITQTCVSGNVLCVEVRSNNDCSVAPQTTSYEMTFAATQLRST